MMWISRSTRKRIDVDVQRSANSQRLYIDLKESSVTGSRQVPMDNIGFVYLGLNEISVAHGNLWKLMNKEKFTITRRKNFWIGVLNENSCTLIIKNLVTTRIKLDKVNLLYQSNGIATASWKRMQIKFAYGFLLFCQVCKLNFIYFSQVTRSFYLSECSLWEVRWSSSGLAKEALQKMWNLSSSLVKILKVGLRPFYLQPFSV